MIVYDKLANILKERNMNWKNLCESGISTNVPSKFSHNKPVNTDTIDKVCLYLKVQPGDIMEWISDEDYQQRIVEEQNAERISIEKQIEELQSKLKKL